MGEYREDSCWVHMEGWKQRMRTTGCGNYAADTWAVFVPLKEMHGRMEDTH